MIEVECHPEESNEKEDLKTIISRDIDKKIILNRIGKELDSKLTSKKTTVKLKEDSIYLL